MILFSKVFLIWFLLGLIALIWGWIMFHKPENEDKVESDLEELSSDVGISKDDCKVITYLVMIAFGFLIIPIVLVRRILKIRKDK
jgi:hypothetical protein